MFDPFQTKSFAATPSRLSFLGTPSNSSTGSSKSASAAPSSSSSKKQKISDDSPANIEARSTADILQTISNPCKCGETSCLSRATTLFGVDAVVAVIKYCRFQVYENGLATTASAIADIRKLFNASIVAHKVLSNGKSIVYICVILLLSIFMLNKCLFMINLAGSLELEHLFMLGPLSCSFQICRANFAAVYEITKYRVDLFASEYKDGINSTSRDMSDDASGFSSRAELEIACQKNGIVLNQDQMVSALLPNSSKAMALSVWMKNYFLFHGDVAPNKDGEIHLEPIDKCTIHAEYFEDIQKESEDHEEEPTPLSYRQFLYIWDLCYPNVKIREYKAVTGKCKTCANLSEIRRKFNSAAARALVKELHKFHRIAFQSEREAYYLRRKTARENPGSYFSIITDGFAQNHCILPWLANQVD